MTHERPSERGVVLTVVIIVIIMVAILSAFVTNLAYNQKKLMDSITGKRVLLEYRARAGAIHAAWRIRENVIGANATLPAPTFSACTGNPGGTFNFLDAAYTCNYTLDVNRDGTMETAVSIGPETNAQKQRLIQSDGSDT